MATAGDYLVTTPVGYKSLGNYDYLTRDSRLFFNYVIILLI